MYHYQFAIEPKDCNVLKKLNERKVIVRGLACCSDQWHHQTYADTSAQLGYDNRIMCCFPNEGRPKGGGKNKDLWVFRESKVVTFAELISYFQSEFSTYETDKTYRQLRHEKRVQTVKGSSGSFEIIWDAVWSTPRMHSWGNPTPNIRKATKKETGFHTVTKKTGADPSHQCLPVSEGNNT